MFTLDRVLPWGRTYDEYCRMFALTVADLRLKILGCGDGPASFNAEATLRGARVISCDPIYQFTAAQIRSRVEETYDTMIEQTRQNADDFIWEEIRSVEDLGRRRMSAMSAFLDDFEAGKAAGRYVDAGLPALPFPDRSFDLVLCSHFLLLYTTQLGEGFHRQAFLELLRLASEIRVFPILELGGKRSPLVDPMIDLIRREAFDVEIERVPYEFVRGGNEMLRIRCRR